MGKNELGKPYSMKIFEKKILGFIRRHSMLREGETVLLALSGGPDSMCLATVLYRLRGKLNISLEAGHVNYGLRGSDSDQDESFVKDFCNKLDIPLQVINTDPGNNGTGNLEENARNLRYDFLSRIAVRQGMLIATGHNSDDQAETFLLNLLRGAGYKGLSGMLPVREHLDPTGKSCKIIRPLLECTRGQITEYLEETGQDSRTDQSNSSLVFDRNWIRHELLPRLEERFNPGQGERIARASVLIGEAARFLEDAARSELEKISRMSGEGTLQIQANKLSELPEGLQREVLRQAVAKIKGNTTDFTSGHIFALLELCGKQSGRKLCLPGGLEARKDFENLTLRFPGKPTPPFKYRLEAPGEVLIPEAGKKIRLEYKDAPSTAGDKLPGCKITVRNRRPGDRLKISEKRPRQAFSNICTRHRIPEGDRDRILILELPDNYHWVEGIGMPSEIRTSDKRTITITIKNEMKGFKVRNTDP